MNTIPVTVSVSAIGVVSCSPDPVPVSGPDATISFNLVSAGYAFPGSLAIVVPQPSNQFPDPSVTVSPTLATLFDANTDANRYKYVVRLVRTADNEPISFDPMIENGK